MDPEAVFYDEVKACVDGFLTEMPVAATFLGDHRFDDRLGDVSEAGLARRRDWVARWRAAFEAVDPAALSAAARLDRRLMLRVVERVGRQLDRLRAERVDPYYSLEIGLFGILLILQREYAPLPERMPNVVARLLALPGYLRSVQEVLVPAEAAPCWIEPAVFTARTWATILRRDWTTFPDPLPQAAEQAAAALDDYADWVEREVAPRAQADPAAGRELFDEILRRHHGMDLDGESLGRQLLAQLDELDRRIAALPPAEADGGVDIDRLVEIYQEQVAAARELVVREGLATLPPGERLDVQPLHPLLRPMFSANAELNASYLYPSRDAVFTVTPADPADPRQRARLAARHSPAYVALNAAAETYPGKHLRLAAASCRAHSLPRQLGQYLSPGAYQGWAIYAEELLVERGFGGPAAARLHLERQRQRCARAYVDVAVHTGALDFAGACAFLQARGGDGDPEETVLAILREPGDWQAQFSGALALRRAAAELLARRPGAGLGEAHDAILAEGMIPPALLAGVLLDH